MIRLTPGKIAVDPIYSEAMTESGLLHIPEHLVSKCNQGIVKYVGNDVTDIKIGDYVLFSGYTGSTVRLEGEGVLIIMHAEFVNCLIEAPETEIPGIFFKDIEGNFWPATHEMVTGFIAKKYEEDRVLISFEPRQVPDYVRGN